MIDSVRPVVWRVRKLVDEDRWQTTRDSLQGEIKQFNQDVGKLWQTVKAKTAELGKLSAKKKSQPQHDPVGEPTSSGEVPPPSTVSAASQDPDAEKKE